MGWTSGFQKPTPLPVTFSAGLVDGDVSPQALLPACCCEGHREPKLNAFSCKLPRSLSSQQ